MTPLQKSTLVHFHAPYIEFSDSSAQYLFSCHNELTSERYDIYLSDSGSLIAQYDEDYPEYESAPLRMVSGFPIESRLANILYNFWDVFKHIIVNDIVTSDYTRNQGRVWDNAFNAKISKELFGEHTHIEQAIEYCMNKHHVTTSNAFIMWVFAFEEEYIRKMATNIEFLYLDTKNQHHANFTVSDCSYALALIKDKFKELSPR